MADKLHIYPGEVVEEGTDQEGFFVAVTVAECEHIGLPIISADIYGETVLHHGIQVEVSRGEELLHSKSVWDDGLRLRRPFFALRAERAIRKAQGIAQAAIYGASNQ